MHHLADPTLALSLIVAVGWALAERAGRIDARATIAGQQARVALAEQERDSAVLKAEDSRLALEALIETESCDLEDEPTDPRAA